MKHLRKLLPVTVVAVLATALLAFTAADKVLLRLNLKKGQKFSYVLGMQQSIAQTMGEEQMNVNQGIDFIYDMVVDNIDANKNYVIKAAFKTIRMKTSYGGMDVINVDTDKPTAADKANPMSMIGGMMQGMVGQAFTIVIDNKGHIKEVHGIKELVNNMVNNAGLDEQIKATVLQTMESSLNDENITANFGYAFGYFPDAAVGAGESWNNNTSLGTGMAGVIKNFYTVKSISGNNMEVEIKSDIEPGQEEGIKMNGKQNGTITIDTKTGLTTKVALNQDFKGDVEANGQNMPIAIKGTLTMTLSPAQ